MTDSLKRYTLHVKTNHNSMFDFIEITGIAHTPQELFDLSSVDGEDWEIYSVESVVPRVESCRPTFGWQRKKNPSLK